MKISMSLPGPTVQIHDRDEELSWYRSIDEGPWDGLALWDRVVHPGWALFVQLAAAAAVTERVRLWSSIAILPPRSAALVAKEAATIDVLSGGRFTLGVGVGAYDQDYVALDSDLRLKHRRMDDHVAIMRKIWAQEPLVDGQLPIGPVPVQAGGIPLMAGAGGPKALARAARWATGILDGSQLMSFDLDALVRQRDLVRQAWTEAGRTDLPRFSTCVYFALGTDPKNQLRDHLVDYARSSGHDLDPTYVESASNFGAASLLAAVNGAREAGLDDLLLTPTTEDLGELERARDVLGI